MAPEAIGGAEYARNPAGWVAVFTWLMIIWSAATGAAARELPRWWWPQVTGTVAECIPKVDKNIVSSSRDLCSLTWTDDGTQRRTVMEVAKGRFSTGSTLTLVVHGNTAQEPHRLLEVSLIAAFLSSAQAAVFVWFLRWYRRRRIVYAERQVTASADEANEP
jgi:hypothetical protein